MLPAQHCGFGRHRFARPSELLDRPKLCLPALAVCLGLAVFSSAALAQEQPIASGLSSGLDINTQTPFRIWRTTTLGSYKGVDAYRDALDAANIKIGDAANEILGRPAFPYVKEKTEVELTVVSAAELGVESELPLAAPSPMPFQLHLNARQARPLSLGEEQAVRPLDQFKECEVCPEMVVVPAGEFTMGAPESEESSEDNERPQHKVTFAKPFAVSRFAVTFDEWDACVAGGGCKGYRPSDRGWGRGRRPVINLWWEDAKAYVAWLSVKTGKSYRLLSEAEREYVTRAGTTTPFWWGSSISSRQANYDGELTYSHTQKEKGEFRRQTVSVDAFHPNPWGLYQVHGNVFEWVEDCWQKNYHSAPADGSASVVADCTDRVMRGGSWNFPPWQLRAAHRGRVAASAFASGGLVGVGLRVARTFNRR